MTPSKHTERADTPSRNDARAAARKASLRLLEPLAGFALDCGLSIRELTSMLREAAVRSLAAQQLEVARRPNISGIAASSGISRAEISRILNRKIASLDEKAITRDQQSTRKILAAWCHDPKFAAANGLPADLKIYGRGATFESLVRSHGRGIPTRAILDELRRTGAIKVCGSQEIRLNPDRRSSPKVIRALGGASEFLTTTLQGIRQPKNFVNLRTISADLSPNAISILRKEISKESTNFIADIRRLLEEARIDGANNGLSEMPSIVQVAISLRVVPTTSRGKNRTLIKRRNFRRAV